MITSSHFARYCTGRKIIMKIFILLSVIAAAFASQQCGENEHFESCGTACPLTCENYKNPPKACVLRCDIGCQCDEGFVRSFDGRCVRPVQCPQRNQECGLNEHFESCGTACPLTCENYKNPPKACVLRCDIGCHCDEGFVRSFDGRCVRPVQCPQRDQQCGVNEHFESCGTACPLTCENYKNPPKACVLRCDIGCHCDEGFVRSFEGRCVRPVQCPLTVQPLCGENQRFSQCASPCPLTCDNYANPPKICPAMCLLDTCECEQGYVKTREGRCVRPEQCPNSAKPALKTCHEKADPGMCMAYIPSWYFDTKTGKCEQFIYGGCQGNGNRYASEEECLQNCRAQQQSSPDACDFPAEEGVCRGRFLRFYYDRTTGLCQKFIFGGCGGNENNFETVEQCKQTCAGAAPTACQLKKEVGPCKGSFVRYYFNKETGKCEEFVYGGCWGNINNFNSEEECQAVCNAGAAPTASACQEEKEVGPCRALFIRYYFNKETGKCEKFAYGGCLGNSNNFQTEEECHAVCSA